MRLLGVDFGFKRIGLAVAEVEPGIVTARPSIKAAGALKGDAETLAGIARAEEADAVVVGVPTNDQDGRMARICRRLAEQIQGHGVKVHLVDEALTSVEAEGVLREDGLKASQRRKLKDGEAARLILERFIHEQKVG